MADVPTAQQPALRESDQNSSVGCDAVQLLDFVGRPRTSQDTLIKSSEVDTPVPRPIGGFRGEPFNAYPIPSTYSVQESFDHSE